MSRLSAIFKGGRRCFIPYVVAGFPNLDTSRETILRLADGGAGIIEIGIPFSDPVADGPVIQQASSAALVHGHGLEDYLEMVADIRSRSDVGLVMMSYCNPILQYGIQRFEAEAVSAGLDGLLLSDLTVEEYGLLEPLRELDPIFLVAPTSPEERIRKITAVAKGFVYVVSRTGVTGDKTDFGSGLKRLTELLRRHTDLPLAVGFGVSSREDVTSVFAHAQGAVVGSAIVKFMLKHAKNNDLPNLTAQFVSENIFSSELLEQFI